ncbi:tRNA adenosine(34) deaminase TadA [Lachnobacterium bovis]|uniref:tRNA-specific adenosine deaminase n=1 Tax=Lachnobacterium bovis TaxID=140626 RepID=A0A1H9UQH0_9FIRM|nr:tRNA adenosine(34) deaminase TadA [Lachnobacterium bovis]SES11725.1 tRNA(adenine34) deaminase [Lachnobacterium bovis]
MYTRDEKYMSEAIKQAKKALKIKEVPIGCVIVQNDRIIARGYNKRNSKGCVLEHAEISAIKKACKKTGDWRLEDCTMYVTLEPCQMCAGAIVQSRLNKVVIGSMNPKAGCAGSVINLLQMSQFNHQVEIEKGVLEEKCSSMLTEFFKELRKIKKEAKAKERACK